jgi:chromate reductase
MKTILFLVGSLRAESHNRRLANVLADNLPEGYTPAFFDLGMIPLYNDDLTGDKTPAAVTALRDAIRAAAGVFIVSPEYNYAIPGVVKNAIDWASRPMLPASSIVGKPLNVASATVSATNGIRGVVDIKRIWSTCGGVVVNSFDFVLQGAPSRFVTVDGRETLDAAALSTARFAIDNLVRLIEANTAAGYVANWEHFVAGLQK